MLFFLYMYKNKAILLFLFNFKAIFFQIGKKKCVYNDKGGEIEDVGIEVNLQFIVISQRLIRIRRTISIQLGSDRVNNRF